ncbi:MAG TPA: cytochrome C oxidase subunit II [Nitrolancea sp.]|jgi:cytochrome c oxidase subunit 2|nr:cytochrome C oxidase subunit II [Nitrolancea sp.]
MSNRFSAFAKPQGVWWTALGRDERIWIGIATIWGIAMFFMIAVIWPALGNEQNNIKSYRVDPADFHQRVEEFTAAHTVGAVDDVPIVAPEPGGDVYLEAQTFAWRPVIQLKEGEHYHFFISSRDLEHGFSLVMPHHSINLQILPGYVTEVELTPEEAGEFSVICNEYCGLGHHLMAGRIIVTD